MFAPVLYCTPLLMNLVVSHIDIDEIFLDPETSSG